MFNNFHIYYRHILAFFVKNRDVDIQRFNRNLDVRWIKNFTLPEPSINPTQVKRASDTNLESLQDHTSINADLRQMRDTLSSLGSDDKRNKIQVVNFFMKKTRQKFKTKPINTVTQRSKSPYSKKKEESGS